jgi:hypothetical protein
MSDLAALKPFATPRQAEVLEAIITQGSISKAAKYLGIDRRATARHVNAVKAKAARAGYSPEHDYIHPTPDGFLPRGVSTLYDEDGVVKAQWVKSERDKERMEQMFHSIVESMSDSIPRAKPIAAPKHTNDQLLNLYPITDFHLGAYAWAEETGADWDLEIAENLIVDWFSAAIASSPHADTGVLAQMGDWMHYDGLEAVTPEHKNILDSDTRFELLVRTSIRALRRVVTLLLKKHSKLHIIMAEGNHDPASSVWLREWFAALYENEPRVTVDQSPDPYYAYEFGKTLLFVHHGHRKKLNTVDDVFVAKYREQFGRTKHAYAHIGHNHSSQHVESPLMIVEQHRTLAAPDAYASSHGFMSGRSASVVTYHKEYGEVARLSISPEMVS